MTDDEISAEIEKVREEVWQNKLKRGETRRELEQAMAEAVIGLLAMAAADDPEAWWVEKERKELSAILRRYRECRDIET